MQFRALAVKWARRWNRPVEEMESAAWYGWLEKGTLAGVMSALWDEALNGQRLIRIPKSTAFKHRKLLTIPSYSTPDTIARDYNSTSDLGLWGVQKQIADWLIDGHNRTDICRWLRISRTTLNRIIKEIAKCVC